MKLRPPAPQIVKDSERLLREVVRTCADFPNRHKYILSDRMTEGAISGLLTAQNAWRAKADPKSLQFHVEELIELNDRMQALIGCASDLKCFKSAGEYEVVIRIAESIGAQAGGWLNQITGKHPARQNSKTSASAKRSGNLSATGTSSEVIV